jgi:regulator of sirC expression with transglutaminase-like and TPR domain
MPVAEPFRDRHQCSDCNAAAIVRRLLNVPDRDLDYLEAKLAFDAVVDPEIDRAWARAQIDTLAASAKSLTNGDVRPAVRLGAVRRVLYESGPWNAGRSFGFDMTDPDGQQMQNKLLGNYLRTRLGQCVSMPVLFLIMAERLELQVTFCAAPEHIFVRYTDEQGRVHNIETTSGGHPARDEWIRQQLGISDRAVASGIYLRTLTKREGIAMLAHTVVEHLREQDHIEEQMEVCNLMLEHHPLDVNALVSLASAYGELNQPTRERHPAPHTAPRNQIEYGRELMNQNARLFAAAADLGWRPRN